MQTWEEFLKENYELSEADYTALSHHSKGINGVLLLDEIEKEWDEYIKSFTN